MFPKLVKTNVRVWVWFALGTALGIAAANYWWLTLYSVVGFTLVVLTLRAAFLQMLGPPRHVNYQQPDYQQAESTLIGKFPGNGRAMRRPNKAC
jgi:predicted ATP-grasp superfamily ATP-dependent carboligase